MSILLHVNDKWLLYEKRWETLHTKPDTPLGDVLGARMKSLPSIKLVFV